MTKQLILAHNGYDEYKVGGKTHRANGPALIWKNSGSDWWLYGKCHRYYGPADLYGRWYIHGGRIKWD